jgi:pimeloyl-ACP methyl ester carboxylesterase
VREQQARPCDEVLIVGHSIGCTVAALVAARVAQRLAPEARQNMSLVTLGHCIQFLTLMPGADRARTDLHTLAQATDLPWFDMIARADSLCFWQANPLAESGIDQVDAARPITQVVRPFRMFAPADYARIRRNRLRLHFQYVMASAFPNEYDYFKMTAGPTRLRAY